MKAKFFYSLIVFLSFTFKTFAFQPANVSLADSTYKYLSHKPAKMIWVNIGQVLFNQEIQLGFEKEIANGISLEGTVGYKYAILKNQPYDVNVGSLISPGVYYNHVARIPFSNGLLASIAAK